MLHFPLTIKQHNVSYNGVAHQTTPSICSSASTLWQSHAGATSQPAGPLLVSVLTTPHSYTSSLSLIWSRFQQDPGLMASENSPEGSHHQEKGHHPQLLAASPHSPEASDCSTETEQRRRTGASTPDISVSSDSDFEPWRSTKSCDTVTLELVCDQRGGPPGRLPGAGVTVGRTVPMKTMHLKESHGMNEIIRFFSFFFFNDGKDSSPWRVTSNIAIRKK